MSSIERDINSLLKDGLSVSSVGAALFRRLEQERLTPSQKLEIYQFAYNAGIHGAILDHFAKRIKVGKAIPWALFVQLLHENGIKYRQGLATHIFEGAQTQKALKELLNFYRWDHLDPRFHPLRTSRDKDRQAEFGRIKQRLKEKIIYLQDQRMLDEEKRAIEKYEEMYPDDPFVQEQKSAFKERWARELIHLRASSLRESKIRRSVKEHDSYTTSWIKLIQKELDRLQKSFPHQMYDLAVGFMMLDLPELSVSALERCQRSENIEWLLAEALIAADRPLDSIGLLYEIELKYAAKPETSFGVGYLRAQALWKLGQEEMAIGILTSIINIRPKYRSAHALLEEWKR